MVARKRRKAPTKKLSTKLKQNPVGTLKSEWKKLGWIGQGAVIGITAGALGASTASKLTNLPVVGEVMSIFTSLGARLTRGMKTRGR